MNDLLDRTLFADGIVNIQFSRGAAPRAPFWPEGLAPTVIAYSRAFTFPDAQKKERGIRIITTEDRRWHFCNVKSVNLLANAIGKKAAQRASADEVVFMDAGFVR